SLHRLGKCGARGLPFDMLACTTIVSNAHASCPPAPVASDPWFPPPVWAQVARECCDRIFCPRLGFRAPIGYHDRSNVIGGAAGGNLQPKTVYGARPIAVPKWWFCSCCEDG